MSWFKPAVAFVLVTVLAGCGFRPLYARGPNGTGGAAGFATVKIAQVPDRLGQQFRNDLLDMLTPKGEPAHPRYVLYATLDESIEDLAIAKSETATRGNVHMSVNFKMTTVGGESVLSGIATSVASYNVLDSEYATRAALENVRERTVRQLAQDVRVRLGVFFHGVGQHPAPAK